MSITVSASNLNATHKKALTYMGGVRPNVRMIAIEVLLAAQAAGHNIKVVWGLNPASCCEHSAGTALDFMVYNDRAAGDWISSYLWNNRARLGVRWIIWRQRIRSTSPGKPGTWQAMANRGNPTANHMDHPHVNFHVKTYEPPKGGTVPTNPTAPGGGSPSNAKGTPYKVTTKSKPLNGRSGPGTNYPVTMTAAKNYVLNIVETRNGWARSTGGHWYSMKYLTKQGDSKPAPAQKSVATLAQEVIDGKHGNGDARKKSLGSRYNEVQAEVNKRLSGGKKKPSAPKTTKYKVVTRSLPLNGRAGPGLNYRRTMTANKGTVLDIVQVRNGWGRSTGGHWYSMQYLRKV